MENYLKQFRLLNNETQQQVAEAIGCSTVTYSRYETGTRIPSLDILILLADHFSVTIDVLVGHDKSSFLSLSNKESEFLLAFRTSDERAQADALSILKTHKQNN